MSGDNWFMSLITTNLTDNKCQSLANKVIMYATHVSGPIILYVTSYLQWQARFVSYKKHFL